MLERVLFPTCDLPRRSEDEDAQLVQRIHVPSGPVILLWCGLAAPDLKGEIELFYVARKEEEGKVIRHVSYPGGRRCKPKGGLANGKVMSGEFGPRSHSSERHPRLGFLTACKLPSGPTRTRTLGCMYWSNVSHGMIKEIQWRSTAEIPLRNGAEPQ